MQLNDHDVSNQEILEAVNQFATNVEGRFTKIDERFTKIDERFTKIDERFDRVEFDIKEMKATMTTLATKDFVAEENAKLRGDIILLMRKEDSKLRGLVDILHEKNVLNNNDVKRLITMEPFAQLSV